MVPHRTLLGLVLAVTAPGALTCVQRQAPTFTECMVLVTLPGPLLTVSGETTPFWKELTLDAPSRGKEALKSHQHVIKGYFELEQNSPLVLCLTFGFLLSICTQTASSDS